MFFRLSTKHSPQDAVVSDLNLETELQCRELKHRAIGTLDKNRKIFIYTLFLPVMAALADRKKS